MPSPPGLLPSLSKMLSQVLSLPIVCRGYPEVEPGAGLARKQGRSDHFYV